MECYEMKFKSPKQPHHQAAVESASEDEDPSNCDNIPLNVRINSSRETWLFLN